MDTRTDFLLQLLQKLGAPLMAAVNVHSKGAQDQDAQTMAALLSESVKLGLSMSQSLQLKTEDGNGDAIRVGLAALGGGLVAESYKETGRVPADSDRARIQKVLESVIVFADNFAPAAEHAQRLKTLEGPAPFFDPAQTNLYALHALLPAITAISEFSFGQEPAKLAQDVASRLGAKAKDLQKEVAAENNAMGELVAMQALAKIYAAAHLQETARLKSGGEAAAANIDDVWKGFETQAAMLSVLLKSMQGGQSVQGSGGSGGVKPAAIQQEAPIQPPAAPPQAAEAPPAEAPAGNPMSFFKKK